MKRFWLTLLAAGILVPGGCSRQGEDSPSSQVSGAAPSGEGVIRTLYIGRGEDFQQVPHTFEGEPTPDALIAAIAEETGWNLALAESVASGKGGMSVLFSKESALFTGFPDPQKEEYAVDGPQDLAFHILDSIQRTLQWNTINPQLGDPANLDVYFAVGGNEPLSWLEWGIELPLEEPYPGSAALQRVE